ncbi:MAG: glycosyltransferase [Kiritimatiellia bacterium]
MDTQRPDRTNATSPYEKPDRRRRARSRPTYSTRRTDPRYWSDFPVQIVVGSGKSETTFAGTARDVSDGGLLIESPDVPAGTKTVRLRFEVPEGILPEEYIHGTVDIAAEVRRHDAATAHWGMKFVEPLSHRLARSTWTLLRWAAIALLMAAIATTLFLKYQNFQFFWFDAPLFFYSILVGGFLISRFVFAAFYRNPPPRTETPPVTLLVPVFNEAEQIERTLRQVMNLEYPAGKLQVIAIDDGSTDGTPAAIQRARDLYPEIEHIRFEPGRGKRHALSAGVRRATGQFIVFIDSDSFLEADAIHRLLDHFGDPEVAAVTGHCDVENVWTNALTKMQSVRYYVAFRVMKAAESVFDSITCLSGPLACYRRERLLEVLDAWEGQTFLGRPATFGDDRSLTNLLLRRGHKVRYAEKAQCTTIVPEDHRTFLRQQLRWKRSWFRESLVACTFMWKKQPLMALSFYLGFLLPLVAPLVVLRALVLVPMLNAVWPINYVAGVLVMSAMISSVYLLVKRSRLWLYGIMFCFYYMFILVWQLPIAVLTFAETSWGTRSKAEI